MRDLFNPEHNHSVYICRDVNGVVIYVGISMRPWERISTHSQGLWWKSVAAIEIEHMDSRESALERESELIALHSPIHNRAGNKNVSRRYKQLPVGSFRNRSIRWGIEFDAMAVEMAHELRLRGGVSELVSRLIEAELADPNRTEPLQFNARLITAERKRKRGIAHLHSTEASK